MCVLANVDDLEYCVVLVVIPATSLSSKPVFRLEQKAKFDDNSLTRRYGVFGLGGFLGLVVFGLWTFL